MTVQELIDFCKKQLAKGSNALFYKAILDILIKHDKEQQANTVDKSLYQKCIDAYDKFLKENIGVGVKMSGAQGKAMKDIIKYLKSQSHEKTDEGVIKSWDFILKHWNRQNEFIGKQKNLTQINKNLIEILDNLRNGNSKVTKQLSKAGKDQLKRAIAQRGQS